MTTDSFQTKINQLSLVMTISEDIIKACRENDLSIAMTETLLRLHNQQTELEKALNETRKVQYQMALVIEQVAGVTSGMAQQVADISNHVGFDPSEHVTAEEVGQDH